MKKILFSTIIGLAATLTVQAQTPCSRIVTISSDITTNRTLYSDSIYRISGNVAVTAPHILTIQAGTIVEMQQNSILEILQGAQINATGTAIAPIIFTPDVGAPGSRAQVSNASIIIAGRAATSLSSTTLPGGESFTTGTSAGDNSGTLQYVQIHYLNGSTAADFENALTFIGVGSGTTIDHVEVSNSGRNGVGILGGTATFDNLVTMDNYENGVRATFGTQAILNGYLELRENMAAHYSAGSNGIKILNNPDNETATPVTHVTLNNASIIGPGLCHDLNSLSSDFRDGIYIGGNAEAEVYNSVIAGQRRNGLFLDGDDCIAHTGTDDIQFSFNSFYGNGQSFDAAPSISWTSASGCDANMSDWITGGTDPCKESGNQLPAFTLGYDASFCDDYCDGSFVQNFVLNSSSGLLLPDIGTSLYDNRGSVQLSNRFDWLNVCPQDKVYCEAAERPSLNFAPNPAKGSSYALFSADKTGKVTIAVLNSITGAVLSQTTSKISTTGRQKVAFSLEGLREGVYTVRVQTPEGMLYGKLVVQ